MWITACSCQALLLIWGEDFRAARRLQEEALRTNPSSAHVHAVLGEALNVMGRHDEALKELQVAMRLSPKDMDMSFFLALESEVHLALGDYEAAISAADRALTFTPLAYQAHVAKIVSLHTLGRVKAARSALEDMLHHVPGFNLRSLYERPITKPVEAAIRAAGGGFTKDLPYQDGISIILRRVGWQG